MSALLIVRAEVVDVTARDDFDHWYQHEHLPDATQAFNALRSWRGWSDVEPHIHYAFYEFDDLAAAQQIAGSQAIKSLIAEFDRLWEGRVIRTRDIVNASQAIN